MQAKCLPLINNYNFDLFANQKEFNFSTNPDFAIPITSTIFLLYSNYLHNDTKKSFMYGKSITQNWQ